MDQCATWAYPFGWHDCVDEFNGEIINKFISLVKKKKRNDTRHSTKVSKNRIHLKLIVISNVSNRCMQFLVFPNSKHDKQKWSAIQVSPQSLIWSNANSQTTGNTQVVNRYDGRVCDVFFLPFQITVHSLHASVIDRAKRNRNYYRIHKLRRQSSRDRWLSWIQCVHLVRPVHRMEIVLNNRLAVIQALRSIPSGFDSCHPILHTVCIASSILGCTKTKFAENEKKTKSYVNPTKFSSTIDFHKFDRTFFPAAY